MIRQFTHPRDSLSRFLSFTGKLDDNFGGFLASPVYQPRFGSPSFCSSGSHQRLIRKFISYKWRKEMRFFSSPASSQSEKWCACVGITSIFPDHRGRLSHLLFDTGTIMTLIFQPLYTAVTERYMEKARESRRDRSVWKSARLDLKFHRQHPEAAAATTITLKWVTTCADGGNDCDYEN